MSTKKIIVSLGILAIMALLTLWAMKNFEIVETEKKSGFKGEARTNPYYAARQYLRAMGFDARILTTLELHNRGYQNGSTLFYIGDRYALGEQRSNEILDWAKNGGHLIFEPDYMEYLEDDFTDDSESNNYEFGDKGVDFLAEALQITQHELEEIKDQSAEPDKTTSADDSSQTTQTEHDHRLEIEFDNSKLRTHTHHNSFLSGNQPDDRVASDAYGPQIISRSYGKGLISVITTFDLFDNFRIENEDHARYLSTITAMHAQHAQVVWLLHDTSMPPLWKLILNHAMPVVCVAIGTLLIWMLSGAFRFGPIIRQPEPAQRQLLEHIDAAGHFHWQRSPRKLYANTQTALHTKIAKNYPQWLHNNDAAKYQLLTKELHLTQRTSNLVLAKPADLDSDELFSAIKTLEIIRKQL